MDKEEILQDLNSIKLLIQNLERKVNTIDEKANSGKDKKRYNIIKKYVLEHGVVLQKEQQGELYNKLREDNFREIGLIKLFKKLNIQYKYLENNKEWKDVIIDFFEDEIAEIEDLNN
ncbi:MAG: hypothetical protein ACLU4S_02585 [Clostridium perfringens]